MSGKALTKDTQCRSFGYVNNPPRGYFRTVKTCYNGPNEACRTVAKGDVQYKRGLAESINVVQRGLSAVEHVATGQMRLTLSEALLGSVKHRFVSATLACVPGVVLPKCDHISYVFEDATTQQSLLVKTTTTVTEEDAQTTTDFTGAYVPDNWEVTEEGSPSSQVIFQLASPATSPETTDTLVLISRNDGITGGDAKACITIDTPCPVALAFDWQYSTVNSGSEFDPFGFELNDVFVELTQTVSPSDANQMGSEVLTLKPGDTCCFVQNSTDGAEGAATTIVTNFSVDPECDAGCNYVDRPFCFGVCECVVETDITVILL